MCWRAAAPTSTRGATLSRAPPKPGGHHGPASAPAAARDAGAVRRPPRHLRDDEITAYEGIPIVTPVCAILDAHASRLGPALIDQAIADGQRLGVLSSAQAEQFRAATAGTAATDAR